MILKDKSREEAVDWLLQSAQKDDLRELPSWYDEPLVRKVARKDMTVAQRKAYQKERKFYKEFISEELNDKEIRRISMIFYKSDYDINLLLREILMSSDFWDVKNRGVLVKSPVELIVGTLRSFEVVPENINSLVGMSRRLKQDIFNPPNVKGWVGGIYWLDSNSILLRNQIISRFVRGKGKGRKSGMMMSNDIFENSNFKNSAKKGFLQHYFLALYPITEIDYSKNRKSVIASLLLDPIYQLK